jgi:hypothetical protein
MPGMPSTENAEEQEEARRCGMMSSDCAQSQAALRFSVATTTVARQQSALQHDGEWQQQGQHLPSAEGVFQGTELPAAALPQQRALLRMRVINCCDKTIACHD